MKQAEWNDLCEREQDGGGQVVGVTLTLRSIRELANEFPWPSEVRNAGPGRDAEGRCCVITGEHHSAMLNQAAGGKWAWVDIDEDAEADMLTVLCADGETRIVPSPIPAPAEWTWPTFSPAVA